MTTSPTNALGSTARTPLHVPDRREQEEGFHKSVPVPSAVMERTPVALEVSKTKKASVSVARFSDAIAGTVNLTCLQLQVGDSRWMQVAKVVSTFALTALAAVVAYKGIVFAAPYAIAAGSIAVTKVLSYTPWARPV